MKSKNLIMVILFVSLFLISVVSVNATLLHKFKLETNTATTIDSLTSNYLTSYYTYNATNIITFNGVEGSAVKLDRNIYRGLITQIGSGNFTVNFWSNSKQIYLKISDRLNTETTPYNSYGFYQNNNTVTISKTINLTTYGDSGGSGLYDGEFHQYTIILTKPDTLRYYIDAVLIHSNTFSGALLTNLSYLTIGNINMANTTYDELSVYNTALSLSEIQALYTDIATPPSLTDFTVTLSSINTYLLNDIIYVHPLYLESRLIKGYYSIYTNLQDMYYSKVCDLNNTVALIDNFAYDNITKNGWSSACEYKTQPFLQNTFGLSLFLNNSDCVSTLTKTIDVNNNAEFSFIAKPVSYNQPLGNLSSCFLIGLRSSQDEDLTPIKLCYDYPNSLLKLYAYNPSETLIFNIPYVNTYVNVTQYVDFDDKSYSLRLKDYDSNIYLSEKINFYYASPLDIGKIIISPIDDSSSSYIDNIVIKDVSDYPTLFLYNGSFNISDNCDYSTIKCYTTRFFLTSSEQIYNNFEDISLCSTYYDEYGTNTLTGESHLDSNIGEGLSTTTKYIIVIISVVLLFGVCLAVGFAYNNAIVGMVTGGFLAVSVIFFFTLIEWIPILFLVTIIIVSVAIAIIGSIFVNKNN